MEKPKYSYKKQSQFGFSLPKSYINIGLNLHGEAYNELHALSLHISFHIVV
jgi:hypothetical protein